MEGEGGRRGKGKGTGRRLSVVWIKGWGRRGKEGGISGREREMERKSCVVWIRGEGGESSEKVEGEGRKEGKGNYQWYGSADGKEGEETWKEKRNK